MYQGVLHEVRNVVVTHRNDDLLSKRTLCGYLDTRFGFGVVFDYVIDLIDFFSINGGKCFLDLDDLRCTDVLFWCLSIQFGCQFRVIIWFAILEVFRDSIDFLLRFCRDRQREMFYLYRLKLVDFFVVLTNSQLDFQSIFGGNFLPKQVRVIVHVKRVPVSVINWRDKIPNSLTNTFEIFKIIWLQRLDLLVGYVLSHKVKRVLNILCIWTQVFNRFMKQNRVETSILEFWFSRHVGII